MIAQTIPLPGLPVELLPLLQEAASGRRVALVGGVVRDLLLHRVHKDPWRGVPDLDLVVEGKAAAFVQRLQELLVALPQSLHESRSRLLAVHEHSAYGTVELELQLSGQIIMLDIASARRETYPQPGANPVVTFGTLSDDLARRDFSVNAIAIVLNPETNQRLIDQQGNCDFGKQLLDPHGGQEDLCRRQLRFLHDRSVADDPTRLVRAARYAARMGLMMTPEALIQARETVSSWPWKWRCHDPAEQAPSALGPRLRMELELMLEREPWPQAMAILQFCGGLQLLDKKLQLDLTWRRRLGWAQRFKFSLLTALVAGAAEPLKLAARLQLPHRQCQYLLQWLALRQRWSISLRNRAIDFRVWDASDWCHWLESPSIAPEAVILELISSNQYGQFRSRQISPSQFLPRRPLLRWLLRWRHIKSAVNAADLMAAEQLMPGPYVGERLRQIRAERLREERL